eukprot:1585504-Pleurochrysis_carterae.AAC.3
MNFRASSSANARARGASAALPRAAAAWALSGYHERAGRTSTALSAADRRKWMEPGGGRPRSELARADDLARESRAAHPIYH